MNVKRFTARTSRDALNLVKQAFGDDAVVLSTRPCAEGVEVLAMAADSVQQIERVAASVPTVTQPAAKPQAQPAPVNSEVAKDVEKLAMSTLSFQDYVRERMLKRRNAALKEQQQAAAPAPAPARARNAEPAFADTQSPYAAAQSTARASASDSLLFTGEDVAAQPSRLAERMASATPLRAPAAERAAPVLHDAPVAAAAPSLADAPTAAAIEMPRENAARDAALARREQNMMDELRSMKGLIEERFGALAFMEKLQRNPAQARLTQRLLDCGFSPALIRKLAQNLSADIADESAWASSVLERNLLTGEQEAALEDQGGVFALIGATGVGKTTSTAKLAAAFATRYGAANLGLITLDAYRVGAHEQLRAYGRILGVPVHTAHDRASLEDLLELLAGKKMVLIDTAGMAQRDTRTRELLDMLGHRSIQKLVVVNAAAQGETIEDVLHSYRASSSRGVILSKMDEAVKLGPALDALIRHRLPILGVANGQRVPEDWHRLSSHALVHRALRPTQSNAYKMDESDVNLVFAAPHAHMPGAGVARAMAQ